MFCLFYTNSVEPIKSNQFIKRLSAGKRYQKHAKNHNKILKTEQNKHFSNFSGESNTQPKKREHFSMYDYGNCMHMSVTQMKSKRD
jgi:hypothetical protein